MSCIADYRLRRYNDTSSVRFVYWQHMSVLISFLPACENITLYFYTRNTSPSPASISLYITNYDLSKCEDVQKEKQDYSRLLTQAQQETNKG